MMAELLTSILTLGAVASLLLPLVIHSVQLLNKGSYFHRLEIATFIPPVRRSWGNKGSYFQ